MNGSSESARNAEQQTTNDAGGKQVDYDSPLPQLLAAIDAVWSHVKEVVTAAQSQRLAAYALWLLQKIAGAIIAWSNAPDRTPHPRQLDKLDRQVIERSVAQGLVRTRKRRRLEEHAPSHASVGYHLGGVIHDGDGWAPAPAITEKSEHAELLSGLDNLHRFAREMASQSPERAMTVVREYGRVVAFILGSTKTFPGSEGNILRASHSALRNWDILKDPRAPAPGFQLPCKSAPIFDVHSVLDTGELQISLVTHLVGTGMYDRFVDELRQKTQGNETLFDEVMEALAFAKGSFVGSSDTAELRVSFLEPKSAARCMGRSPEGTQRDTE
jgi:hypothetical protein